MSIFQRLFGNSHGIKLDDLKTALKDVERDRRRNRLEIRRWERKRKKVVDKMKKARSEGSHLEVDYLWDEFKGHRRSGGDLRREGRIFNVEAIALKRYVRALERLEKRKEREGASRLLQKIQSSGLAERLSLDIEEESHYLEEVNAILDEFGGADEDEVVDPEKAMFLAELDTVRGAEEDGDHEEATSREDEMLERFSSEPEGGDS